MIVIAFRLFLVIALFSAVGCGVSPPLSVHELNGRLVVDLRTLSDYPSTVTRVRLSENSSGRVVWEIQSASGTPQIWTIELSAGPNATNLPPNVQYGNYSVVAPLNADRFFLQSGIEYLIQVWGESAAKRPATARFRLPP
jgi:hypothetical protein